MALLDQFQSSFSSARVTPKGVKVSPDLWRELSRLASSR
jgi:hypothetical protein